MKGKIFMYRRTHDAVTFTEIDGGFVKDYRSGKYDISTSIDGRVIYTVACCCKAIPYDAETMIIEAIIKQNFDCDFTEKIVPILVNKILNLEPHFKTIQMPEPVKTELGKEYCIELAKCIAIAIMLNTAVINQTDSSKSILSKLDMLEPLSCMSTSFTGGVRDLYPSTLIGLMCMEMAYVLTESEYCPISIPVSEKSARVLKSTARTLLKKYIKGIKDGSIVLTDEDISNLIEDFTLVLHIFRELPIMIKEDDVRYAWLGDINRRCLEQEMLPTDIDDTEAYKMLYSNISNFNSDGTFSDILKQISSFAGYDEDDDDDIDDEDDDDVEESEELENSDDEKDEMFDIEEFKRHNRSHKIDGKDIAKNLDKIFGNLISYLTSESEDEDDDDSEDSDEDDAD